MTPSREILQSYAFTLRQRVCRTIDSAVSSLCRRAVFFQSFRTVMHPFPVGSKRNVIQQRRDSGTSSRLAPPTKAGPKYATPASNHLREFVLLRKYAHPSHRSPPWKFPLRPSPQRAKRERQSQNNEAKPRPSRSGSNGHDAGKATQPPQPATSPARGVAVDPAQQARQQRPPTGHTTRQQPHPNLPPHPRSGSLLSLLPIPRGTQNNRKGGPGTPGESRSAYKEQRQSYLPILPVFRPPNERDMNCLQLLKFTSTTSAPPDRPQQRTAMVGERRR